MAERSLVDGGSRVTLDVYDLAGVRSLAMPGRLFHQFPPMGEDEGLLCILARRLNSIDELSEDHLLLISW